MRWFLLFGVLLLVGACDSKKRSGGGVDSESHWLETCQDDSTCGGLACVCGVCSRACDDTCADFSSAECAPFPGCPAGERICVPAQMGDQGLADAGPDAITLDVSMPDAATPDGTTPDGATPDGATPDGATPDGASPDGAAPDGPIIDGAIDDGVDAGMVQPDAGCPDPTCCTDEDCPGPDDRCVVSGMGRQGVVCDFDAPPGNACLSPQCVRDEQCAPGETCVQPGTADYTIATCVPQRCQQAADCVDDADGECLPFLTPCNTAGYACWYPGNLCRTDEDCPQRAEPQVCLPQEDFGTMCTPALQR